jgi:hypothetical protein
MLSAPEHDRVAVNDVVDAIHRRGSDRVRSSCQSHHCERGNQGGTDRDQAYLDLHLTYSVGERGIVNCG